MWIKTVDGDLFNLDQYKSVMVAEDGGGWDVVAYFNDDDFETLALHLNEAQAREVVDKIYRGLAAFDNMVTL